MTFSVVFAYVADVTTDEERSAAYGLVSEERLHVVLTPTQCQLYHSPFTALWRRGRPIMH